MQELKKIHPIATENDTAATRLFICLQGMYHHLAGRWQWEMATDTVFCSDVMMCWPTAAEGTRAIFYPDDVPQVKAALRATTPQPLSFRIITTYGEVKTLYGEDVLPADNAEDTPHPVAQWSTEAEQAAEAAKEAARNALQLSTFDYAERLTKSGVWYTNLSTGETWFSDEMYRLLGLPPQSLNPHSNSLYAFLHAEDRKETIEALEESFAKQFPLHLEFRVVQAGGTERWMQQSTTFWFNKSGQVMMSGLLQDVTAQKESELLCESLEATTSFQKQLLHFAEGTANIGYWYINVVTKKVVYSDNFLRLFGLRPQSAATTASSLTNLVHPDDRELYEQVQVKIRREHAVPDFDFRIVRPDGKTRYIRQRGKVIVTGAEVLLAGTIQDVTVQRSLELKLAEAQRNAKVKVFVAEQIEAAARVGSWVMNVKTEDVEWSDNFHTLVGIKAATTKTTQALLLRAVHPDDQKRFSDELALAVREGKPSEFPFRLIRRGEVRHLQASFRVATVEDERLFIGVLQDVTPEQQTVQTLTERLRLIEALADSIPDQVFVTDTNNTLILWNRRCEEMHHRKREKVIGENFFDVLPSLRQELVITRFDRALAGEEIQLRDEPGRYTLRGFYNMSHIPLPGADGKINGILHILHDVTAEHDLYQQLTSRLQFIERLLEVSADSIVALDHNMNYLYWNKRAEKNFGLTGQAVIGKNILEVFPEVPQLLYQDFRRALRGESVHLPATDEHPQENYLIPVRDQREEVTSVLWVQHDRSRDFTIRRQSQKALDIVSALNENYLELDQQYRLRFANDQTLQYFQRSEAELIGKVLWEVFPVLIDSPLHLALAHAMEERIVIRREFASPLHGISLLVSIAPTVDGLAVAFSDISFMKAAEEKMAAEHRRLNEAQAIGRVGSFEWAAGEETSFWSDELFHIHGLQPGEIITTLAAVHSYIHPHDQAAVQETIATSLKAPGFYKEQHRIIRKDGKVRWVNHEWECIAGKMGTVARVSGIVQDITQRKNDEDEILRLKDEIAQKATDKYQTLFNSIDEGFYLMEVLFDENNQPVELYYLEENPAAVRMANGTSLVGKTLRQTNPAYETYWYEIYGEVALTGVSKRMERYADPLNKWFNFVVSRMGDEASRQVAVVFQDITERKRREQHQEYLIKLADALRSFSDPLQIQRAAMRVIGEQFGAGRVLYSTITPDGERWVTQDNYTSGRLPKLVGSFPTASFGASVEPLSRGEVVVYPDVDKAAHLTKAEKQLYEEFDTRSVLGVPLFKDNRWIANIGIHHREPYGWKEEEIELVRETAERTWQAVERANAEEALRKSEEKYRTLFDSMEEGVSTLEVIFDAGGKAVDCIHVEHNLSLTKQTGLTSEIMGKRLSEVYTELEPYWIETFGRVATTGGPERHEYYLAPLDKWFDMYVSQTGDKGSNTIILVYNDITERKRREANNAFLNEVSLDLAQATYVEGTMTAIGEKAAAHLALSAVAFAEITADETGIINHAWHQPGMPDLRGRYAMRDFVSPEVLADCRTGRNVVINNVATDPRTDGEQYAALNIGSFLAIPLTRNGVWGFLLCLYRTGAAEWRADEIQTARELADRVWTGLERARAEEALRKSEAQLSAVFDVLPAGLALADASGKILRFNEAFDRIWGKPPVPQSADDYAEWKAVWADTGKPLAAGDWAMARVLRTGEIVPGDVVDIERFNGESATIINAAAPIRDAAGTVVGGVVAEIDITAQRQAEKALVESEEAFRSFVTASSEVVYKMGPDWKTMFQLEGKNFLPNTSNATTTWLDGYIPEHEKDRVQQAIQTAIDTKTMFELEHQVIDAEGKLSWVLSRAVPRLNEGGEIIEWFGTASNITVRKKAEQTLQQFNDTLEQQVTEHTEELRQSTAYLQAAVNITTIGMAVVKSIRDKKNRIVDFEYLWANKQTETLAGENGFVGSRMLERFPAIKEIGLFGQYVKVVEQSVKIEFEHYFEPLKAWYRWVGIKLDDGLFMSAEDITSRKEMEETLRERAIFTETVIDASIDQITIFDRDERFLVWNKKAEEAGGVKREEVIGKTIAEVFPDIADEPEFLDAQQRALAGEPVYIPAKRGLYSTAYQQWFYVPLKDEKGNVYAVMNIIHDITDKVQAEEQLKRKNQQLQERNEEIAHFNFIASHDLKEPLRKVGTFGNWLVEREGQNLSHTGKQMLDKLAGSVQRMELLVDDISTLTRLQKVPGNLEAVELNLVLRKALVVLHPTITATDAVVDGGNLPTIPGYKEQLETLFVNLISNGIKFQKEGMIPAVEISCKRRTNPIGLPRGEWYCLRFLDNGIGFDVQYSDKIFRVFQRLHGQSEYPGTGMGLAICRKVMENHNGFITAASEPGKGARFDCWFPVI